MFYTSYTNAIIFNSKINLRLEISSLLKINSTINLFQQFQISIKNYFFLLDYIFSNNSKEEIIKDINDKIFSSSEKILSDFIQKEKEKKILFENNNNKNDESVEKEYQEKEIILKYYIGPINDNIFSLINFATISMDFVHMSGAGHSLSGGDYYTIQANFFERNIGHTILLKCKNGKVIELSTKSLQRDPFVQIYWLPESKVKDIINGEITKIRIRVQNGYVDREIKNNSFSKSVSRCYKLLNEAKKEIPNTDNFRNNF